MNYLIKRLISNTSKLHYKYETIAIHAGQEIPDKSTNSRAIPICII